ncbi:hypothetical protein BG003_007440 [Podila horticola]|nr:hypothetical protein BG003_007440 [Podila horticola]
MPASTDNNFYIHPTHAPHTEPDPRIDSPSPDYSQILTTTDTQDRHASISSSQDGQYTPTLSPPHSPHTQPDPRALSPPIYSLQERLLGLLDLPLDSLPPNNPHTAPVHLISSNPNPQSGEAQLDFIPSPISGPSAPSEPSLTILDFIPSPISSPSASSEPSLTIPDADDDTKYEEQDLNRRNSCSTLTSTIPDANNDTKYETEDSMSSSTTTLVLSVNSHPGTVVPQDDEKTADLKKEPFANGSVMDMDLGKYELDPSTAEKGTFMRRLRSQRIKILWIFWFVALAIVFGVLGSTVWKPNRDISSSRDSDIKSTPPPTNNTTSNNNSNNTISTNNNTNITTSNTSNNATAQLSDHMACANNCGSPEICNNICKLSDASYKLCIAKCPTTKNPWSCGVQCDFDNNCQKTCSQEWGNCVRAC